MWPELFPVAPSRDLVVHKLPPPFDFLKQNKTSLWSKVVVTIPFRMMIGKWVMQYALQDDAHFHIEQGEDTLSTINKMSMEDICCAHYEELTNDCMKHS